MNVYVNYRTMQARVIGDTYAPEQIGLPVPIVAGGTGSNVLLGNSVLFESTVGTRVDTSATLTYVNGNLDIGTIRVTTEGLHGFAPGNVLVENADLTIIGKIACTSLTDGSSTAIDVVPGTTSFPRPLRFLQKELELVRKGLASSWWPSLNLKTFTTSTGSFAGAVTTHRDQIVFVPYDASHIGLVNIHARSFETIDVSSRNAEFGSLARFKGGILTRRGRIAMVPWNADYIGLFEPFSKTIQVVSTGSTGATSRFLGGALLPNGRIVFAPYDASVALTYDEVTNSIAQIALPVAGSAKYAGAVSLPSGNVCFVPHTAQRVALVNADGTSVQEVGNTLTGGNKYVGGVLVPSGKVVFVPYNATSVGVFDPETGVTTTFGNLPAGAGKYAGGFLTPDGKVLFVPHEATSLGLFDPELGTMSTVALPGVFSETPKKFFGGAFSGGDGNAYLASHGHADVCTYGTYPVSDAVPWHHPYVNGSL